MNRRDLLAALAVTAVPGTLIAQRRPKAPSPALRAPVSLVETNAIDARSGRQVKLVRDVMRDRIVLINFMFLGCSTICPLQTAILSRSQRLIGDRMGRDVVFVSVTINPIGDTSAKLRAYADENAAGAGWHFLRASFADTERLRRGFDSYAPVREDHPPVYCIGRVGTPRWTRLYGSPDPRLVAREVLVWA